MRDDVGQALLRPEFAEFYPGIPPNEWRPTALMINSVLALPRYRRENGTPANRAPVLDEHHFMFRTVASAGSHTEKRQRRREGREEGE